MSIKSCILSTSGNFAPLPLRLAVGAVMIGHGGQKLFGLFGGYGLDATAKAFAEMGLNPGMLMAILAGGAEFFGGVLLVLGLFTRVGALMVAVTMGVALLSVHSNAFFLPEGMEFVLTLGLASVSLLISGGGALSIDRRLT